MSTSSGALPAPVTAEARPRASARRLGWAAVLPYLVLLATTYSVFCVTTDDPFITYRYAANILAGHGAVFNVGEPVEGYSSPLHLFLCVLLLKIVPAVDILFKAKLVGLGLAALTLWQTGRLARAAGLSDPEAILAQLLVALNTNFALAGINGLETSLYGCLLLTAVLVLLQELAGQGGPRSAVLLFLAFLARPDALLLFVLLLIVRLVWAVRRVRVRRDLVGWGAIFLLLAGGALLARYAYYGQWVPNTYYAKQVTWAWGLHWGREYLLHPFFPMDITWGALSAPVFKTLSLGARASLLLQIGSACLFWLLAVVGLIRLRSPWVGGVLLAVIAGQIAFVLRFGGDWMPGWRFLAPSLPLLAVLQCHGLRAPRAPGRVRRAVGPVLALILWGACAVTAPHNPWSNANFSTHSEDLLPADYPLGRKWVAVNRYIQEHLPPRSVVAYSEMGYAGYKNPEMTFIDVRGLTDPEIARLPARDKGSWGVDDEDWTEPGDPLYAILMRRQPDAIIAFSHKPQMPQVVLGRYYFTAPVLDPRDHWWDIPYALVYRPAGAFFGQG